MSQVNTTRISEVMHEIIDDVPADSNDVQPGIGTFSMATAITQKPNNIREFVSLFAGGGGGGPPVCNYSDPNQSIEVPRIHQEFFEIFPITPDYTRARISVYSCGWSTDEVSAKIESQNGEIYPPVEITYASNPNPNNIRYEATIILELDNPQPGENYTLHFSGSDGSLVHQFTVVMPSDPRRYKLENGDIALWNFSPNEKVRFYAYAEDAQHESKWIKFVGYKNFVTDEEGELYVAVEDKNLKISVIGEKTGEINGPDVSVVLITE